MAEVDKIGRYGQAISLMLAGDSVTECARKVGISRSLLYVWRDDPIYRALETEMLRQAKSAAASEIAAMVLEAVGAVRDVMRDGKPSERLAAARIALEPVGLIKAAGDTPLAAFSDEELDKLAEHLVFVRAPSETH